jgi:hypothetical protein
MATYLSGNPTFLPTVQPYQPNLQLYAGALQMKQTQYDTNRKKISDLYGSLLNSPMSRDSNIQARDEFFQSIDYEIKKLTSVDLSLQQNVDTASDLFTSLYDNKNIVKDMMWTKNYQNEVSRGESFRNCVDPEKCGGQYWEGGINALQLRREEFKSLSDEEAMGFGDVRYTPYINVQEKASKMFKELGWNVKIDEPTGNWIVTTKNGELIENNLYAHFQNTLGKDPAINDYYKTKAYVERKSWAMSNAQQYGSAQAAEQEYINQTTKQINESLSKIKNNTAHQKQVSDQKAADLKENINKGNIRSSAEVDAEYNRLIGESETYGNTENDLGNAIGTTNNAISAKNLALQGESVDSAMAMLSLNSDVASAAHILAYSDYERTLKENTVAMKEQEHLWRMQEIAYKDQLEDENAKEALGGDPFADYMSGEVRSDADTSDMAAFNALSKETYGTMKKAKVLNQEILQTTFNAAQEKLKAGGNGSAQAGEDAVSLVGQAITSFYNTAKYSKDSSKIQYATKLYNKWNSKDDKEKLGWAKQFDMTAFSEKLPYDAVAKVYNKALDMNVDNTYNKTNRNYLATVRGQLGQQVGVAQMYEKEIEAWKETKTRVAESVRANLRSTGGANSEYYEYLVNDSGDMRSMGSFAFMAAKGLSYDRGKDTKDVVSRFKADPTTQAEYSNIYTRSVEQYNNMSPQRKQQVGSKENYVYNQIYNVAKNRQNNTNPTVQYIDAAGKYQKVSVDQFFTKDGQVRSAYSRYADKWKPGEQSGFWSTYSKAKGLYSGIGSYEEERTAGDAIGDAAEFAQNIIMAPITGIAAAIEGDLSILDPTRSIRERNQAVYQQRLSEAQRKGVKSGSEFISEYKKAFHKATDTWKKGSLGGVGSYAAQDLVGFVDYSQPASPVVQNEKNFLMNAWDAEGRGDAIFTFGDAKNAIPGKSDPNASQFVRDIVGMALKSIDKEGRPTWTSMYNPIGGGKEGYQQYTIHLSDPKFANAFGKGTESFMPQYGGILGSGKERGTVTIYLKDSAANNNLHKMTKSSPMEKQLSWVPDIPLFRGQYDDIQNLRIFNNPTGGPGYQVRGSVAVGYNEDGTLNMEPVQKNYYDNNYSPDAIQYEWAQGLQNILLSPELQQKR